jgi:hypothetical protein
MGKKGEFSLVLWASTIPQAAPLRPNGDLGGGRTSLSGEDLSTQELIKRKEQRLQQWKTPNIP